MRMPMMAVASVRSSLVLALIASIATGCAGDSTAPIASAGGSTLQPVAASHALVGATDGRYTFTIDPRKNQSLEIGPNHLDIPGNAICSLAETSYGPAYWNDRCKSERALVTITAIVSEANSDHPRIDFEPALRFAPDKSVMLYMRLDAKADRAEWASIFYCTTAEKVSCVDESKKDRSLETSVKGETVFRRIKHFSGYIILTRVGSDEY
jgi:hypothetical protein